MPEPAIGPRCWRLFVANRPELGHFVEEVPSYESLHGDASPASSLLVAGDEQAQVVGFQMGGLVKLEPKVDRDGFSVAWALPPDLA